MNVTRALTHFMMKILFSAFLFLSVSLNAQRVNVLASGTKTSLRGLSAVSDKVVWVSGSNGTVGRSVDGGKTWLWISVNDFEQRDFRDIEAFDSSVAIIMAVAEPACILKTTDGGHTWKLVYKNSTKGMFLDAMDFYDRKNGIVAGDPIDNRFFIAQTFDGGDTWVEAGKNLPVANSGEACFASSGTNIRLSANGKFYLVTGGLLSRLLIDKLHYIVPVLQGTESTGANSVAVKNKKIIIVTGGDFKAPASVVKNCAITFDGGKNWTQPRIAPHGYRSCVEYINKNNWLTCGLNGTDFSGNNGQSWQWISKESFHVCRKSKIGNTVFLAGENGKIGKLEW